MRNRYLLIIVCMATFLLVLGCAGANNPAAPEPSSQRDTPCAANHYVWGLWQFMADPEAGALEIIPLREGNMHLNALSFLEPPAKVYLTLESVKFNGNIIEADIGLRNPFLGLNKFTGFDVCGVLITNGSFSGYDDPDLVIAVDGDTRLLNADGYTRWWNPDEFPVNLGTMFSYNDGLLGTPDSIADYNATVNGYKYFCNDLEPNDPMSDIDPAHRGMFSAGQKNIRHYTIELGAAGLVFNYAVDACWAVPAGGPPYIVPDDFGPTANRVEAYRVSVTETINTLWNDGIDNGGNLSLSIDVYDWFNADSNTIKVESPGNLSPIVASGPTGGTSEYSTYEVEITDATPAEGSIGLLITVESEASGYGGLLPGKSVSAYFMHSAFVSDIAPGPGELIALADADAYEKAPGAIVYFNGSRSYDENGYMIVDYEWDFGDSSPTGDGEFVSHQYNNPGLYSVILTVENEIGTMDDDTIGIIVCDCSGKSERHLASGPFTTYDLDPSNEDGRKRSTDHMYNNDYWIMQSADKIVGFDMSQSGNLTPVITLQTGVTGTIYSLDCGLDDRVAWASDSDKTVIHIVDSTGNAITDVGAPSGEEFLAADFDVDDDLWVVIEDAGGAYQARQYIRGDDDSYELDDTWSHELPQVAAAWHVFDIQVLHSTESMYLVSDVILPGDNGHPDWPKPRIDVYDRFGDYIRNVAPYNWSVYQDPFPFADIELDSTEPELEACRLNFFDVYEQPAPYFCSHYRRWTLLLSAIGPQYDNGMHRYQAMDVSNVTKELRCIEIGTDQYYRYPVIPSDW